MDVFRTIIVSEAIAPMVRALADTWEGGVGMFVTPLFTGDTLTHYISTGAIKSEIAQCLPHTDYSSGEPVEHEGDLQALIDSINEDNPEAGATLEGIAAMLSGADVSTQDWRDAIARLGLTANPEVAE